MKTNKILKFEIYLNTAFYFSLFKSNFFQLRRQICKNQVSDQISVLKGEGLHVKKLVKGRHKSYKHSS